MAIQLTIEEMALVKEGKLNPADILKHREIHPVRSIDGNELEQVKQEIRDTNVLYKESIQRNKDLYEELQDNRKKKEEFRNKIAELRIKKKKIMGLVQ